MDRKTELEAPASNLADLFRKEAVRYQAARLQGEVMLRIRTPWLILGLVFSVLLLIVVAVASFGTYARKEMVSGRLVVTEGAIRLSSDRHGFINRVFVRDGQSVEAGQTLFTIRTLAVPMIGTPEGTGEAGVTGCIDLDGDANAGICRITAPGKMVVGVVTASEGQLVAAGMPIAELLPEGVRLAAELAVPSRAIGFMRPGLPVALRYDAFAYRKFGVGRGTIDSVSLAPMSPGSAPQGDPGGQPSYRVRVSMERDYVEAYGKRVPLRPGMSFDAEIIIDRRTLLEWVLDPLYAAGKRS